MENINSDWFYIENDKKIGPLSESEILNLFKNGKLTKETLVWTKGQSEWMKAGQIESFQFDDNLIPPPIPFEQNVTPQIRPWVRYWARFFDLITFQLFLGLLYGLIFKPVPTSNFLLIGVLIFITYLFIEPLLLSTWGTTPGKFLLNIKLQKNDGKKLSYYEGLLRTWKMCYRGMGLGIPIVSFITQYIAYDNLKKNGKTTWDSDLNVNLIHSKIGIARTVILIFSIILLSFTSSFLNILSDKNTSKIKINDDKYINENELFTTNKQNSYIDSSIANKKVENNNVVQQNRKNNIFDVFDDITGVRSFDINSKEYNTPEKRSERILYLFNKNDFFNVIKEAESGNYLLSSSNIIGVSLYNTNQSSRSLSLFADAEKEYPSDCIIKCNIGDAYLSLNKLSSALTKYIEAYNIDNNNKPAIERIQNIEKNVNFSSYGYNRERVTVEFMKMDAVNVFNFFEQVIGKKIIYKGDTSKKTTMKLSDIPVDLVFSVVLNLNDLESSINNNVIYVYNKKHN